MKRSELKKHIEEIIEELLDESTIDVSNPNLTPAQKQQFINTARQTTKNPKLGTVQDPVDFV